DRRRAVRGIPRRTGLDDRGQGDPIVARRAAQPLASAGLGYSAAMTLQRAALWAVVVAATVYLLVAGRGLLLPLVLGLALWYMVDSLADAFEQPRLGGVHLPRPVALVAAILATAARVSPPPAM